MRIRPAADTDSGNISTLIRGLSHLLTISPDGVGAEQFLATISEEAIRRYITAGNFLYMVAEIGNELVGAVALRDQTHLYHLFVAPAFQRQGLARLLWSTVREAALAKGNAGAFTVNSSPNALPIYERFGFVQDGPRVETHGVAFIPMRLTIDNNGGSPAAQSDAQKRRAG